MTVDTSVPNKVASECISSQMQLRIVEQLFLIKIIVYKIGVNKDSAIRRQIK